MLTANKQLSSLNYFHLAFVITKSRVLVLLCSYVTQESEAYQLLNENENCPRQQRGDPTGFSNNKRGGRQLSVFMSENICMHG